MKKLVLAFGALLAMTMFSCIGDGQQQTDDQQEKVDTVEVKDAPIEVTGVAIDGAMNSVYLKVGNDTIEFSGSSSVGRASASQAEGRGSESRLPLKHSKAFGIKRVWL